MISPLIELGGEVITPAQLQHPWARAFARYVSTAANYGFDLVECRRMEGIEGVSILARAEVPQRGKYDIRYEEPLLVLFDLENRLLPDVMALRIDFPDVPHLNLRTDPIPKSLCLFAERPEEVRLRWTPSFLGERILWWLQGTARGTLHRGDQPLEPFIGGSLRPIILPPDIFAEADKEILHVYQTQAGPSGVVLIADRPGKVPESASKVTLFPFVLEPQEHGVIRYEPNTLKALQDLCQSARVDLLLQLRRRLQEKVEDVRADTKGTILVLAIPKRRTADGPVESVDYRGFRCLVPKGDRLGDVGPGKLGQLLGVLTAAPASTIFTKAGRRYYPAIAVPEQVEEASGKILLQMLTPNMVLTLEDAALLSGHQGREAPRIFAVGQGALGSQVFANLARQAYGQWVLVDDDYLAPHNSVRHQVFGRRFGEPKAKEMADEANQMFAGPPIAQSIEANVLAPREKAAELAEHSREAELILDMSASVPVARYLALDLDAPSKRAAVFLSPTGQDLVLMSEGAGRAVPLDLVELQYLRAVINAPELEGHLVGGEDQIRYGGSCRDLSSRISQEKVGLHAAIGAAAVREAAGSAAPMLSIWRCDPTRMTVQRHDVELHTPLVRTMSDWTLVMDEGLISKVMGFRAAALPNETCGVLLGYFDTQRRRVYLVDALPAPTDSVEEPASCERGIEGLEAAVERISDLTVQQVAYIGEWHSHPDGAACLPSQKDLVQLEWVKSKMHPEGKTALMLIACEQDQFTCLVVEPSSVE